jgi:hypothetical protein
MMERDKGYWISSSAVPGPPNTRHWESLGIILKDGRLGLRRRTRADQRQRHHVRPGRPSRVVGDGNQPDIRRPLPAFV